MKPRPFDYVRARDLDHAVDVLADVGAGGRALAGGQSLIPLLSMRRVSPATVVDLGGLGELDYLREDDTHLEIGAMTRTRDAERSPLAGRVVPLLPAALRYVGNVTVRNRGTLGGSLAHADPAAEMPAVLRALDGEVLAVGPHGPRTIPAAKFFLDVHRTALAPGELITALRLPTQPEGTSVAVQEFAARRFDRAVVGVFGSLRMGPDELVEDVSIAVAGAGPIPLRATAAEDALRGARPTPSLIVAAAAEIAAATDPETDIHGTAEHRRRLTEVLGRRCLEQLTPSITGSVCA